MKTFNVKNNVGKIKYLVSFHDGIKQHSDGSKFFDIAIFKSVKTLNAFTENLIDNNYTQTP
jgi:hypothetical protein